MSDTSRTILLETIFNGRSLDYVIDAVVFRNEAILDSLPFTINMITAKRHSRDLEEILVILRSVRDEKTK